MSHNQSDTSQSEVVPLVTIEDTNQPDCSGCDHPESSHGMSGCHAGWREGRCECSRTHREVTLDHIEAIVRRETARELDRLSEEQQAIADSHGTYPMEAPFHAAFARHLKARAEVVRNG